MNDTAGMTKGHLHERFVNGSAGGVAAMSKAS